MAIVVSITVRYMLPGYQEMRPQIFTYALKPCIML